MADRKGKARAWSAQRAWAAMNKNLGEYMGLDVPVWQLRELEKKHFKKAYLDGWDAALNSSDPIGDREREWTRLGMSPQAKRKGAAKCLGFHCAQGGECPACDEAQAKRGKGKSGEGR